jgi:hypothetical protein
MSASGRLRIAQCGTRLDLDETGQSEALRQADAVDAVRVPAVSKAQAAPGSR